MAITLRSNTIRVEAEPEGAGSSLELAYNFDDIYDADIENEWDVITKIENAYFFNGPALQINANTYFKDSNKYIYFDTTEKSSYSIAGYSDLSYCTFSQKSMTPTNTGIAGSTAIFNYCDFLYLNYVGTYRADAIQIFNHCTFKNVLYVYIGDDTIFNGGIINGGNGLWFRGSGVVDGLTLMKTANTVFMADAPSGTYTIRNIIVDDSTNVHVRYRLSANLSIYNFIDCKITPTKRAVQAYKGEYSAMYAYFKTTFSASVKNADTGSLFIYDASNNEIYDETLASDEMIPQEITYGLQELEGGNGEWEKFEYTVFSPFTLKVFKEGYQDLIISNIEVVPGQPTIIRGELIPEIPPPVYITSIVETHCSTEYTDDGTITIIVDTSSGTEPYSYSIDGGETWESESLFENLTSGTYEVKAKDDIGSESETFNVEITRPILKPTFLTIPSPNDETSLYLSI